MSSLTAREREVVRLLAQGRRPCQIARQLCISQRTVYVHIQHCRAKTDTSSGYELAVKAATELLADQK
jgi:DNA-binding CsgD family transcriptional regulator